MPRKAPDRLRLMTMLHAVVHSQDIAWTNFHILRGIANAYLGRPQVGSFDRLVPKLRVALFDALFAAIGTLIDRTSGTSSLHQLAVLLKRDTSENTKSVQELIYQLSSPKEGPIFKIMQWRNLRVAHRTELGRDYEFFEKNRISLAEIERALKAIDAAVVELTTIYFNVHQSVRGSSKHLIADAESFVSALQKFFEQSISEAL